MTEQGINIWIATSKCSEGICGRAATTHLEYLLAITCTRFFIKYAASEFCRLFKGRVNIC